MMGKNVQFQITCPTCKAPRWAWWPVIYYSRSLICKSCFNSSNKLPLNIKWKGKLTPVEVLGTKYGRTLYKFKCECGGEISTTAHHSVKSCGCLKKRPRITRRKSDQAVGLTHFRHVYIGSARARNLDYTLSSAQFDKLINNPCNYCGEPPATRLFNFRTRTIAFTCNGIDRVKNTEGYTPQNTVSCCTTCNRLKRAMSRDDFLSLIKKIWQKSCN